MKKSQVLRDHKRSGKTFIPPFNYMFGSLQEISWVKTVLPEIIWIALIQKYHGDRKGVELITAFTRLATKCASSNTRSIFATVSSFGELTEDERSRFRNELTDSYQLMAIQKALLPLVTIYPECPLQFLYPTAPTLTEQAQDSLKKIGAIVRSLYDKASKDTMMVQATAIWLAFDSGTLKVSRNVALANFPEIENYPNTELSRKVAASIRASVNMFFNEHYYTASTHWPRYFWNRGIEIDECYFEEESDE